MTTTKAKKTTPKKMDISDLKPKSSEAKESIEQLKVMQVDADKQIDAMSAEEHEYAIKGECLDKQGNKTKVLIVNTDKEGFVGMFLQYGNPYTFDEKGKQNEDSAKLLRYLEFMSNIDLSDADNQKAIGIKAISKARSLVSTFFTLSLVSALDVADVTDD